LCRSSRNAPIERAQVRSRVQTNPFAAIPLLRNHSEGVHAREVAAVDELLGEDGLCERLPG
jgi:hypothetical protein